VVITLGEWPTPETSEPPNLYDSPEQRRQVDRRFLD